MFALALSLVLMACSDAAKQNIQDNAGSSVAKSAQRSGEDKPGDDVKLARKWTAANNTYLKFTIDGKFEAMFEDGNLIVGTWTISEDSKELKLQGEQAQEGKGTKFQQTYTVLSLSDTNMKVQDAQGKVLEMVAQ